MHVDTLIIGGGLSGLSVANRLSAIGVDFHLIEARNRFGGRILSVASSADAETDDRYDLGPSWFWPGQPRIERLVEDLDLAWFEQAATGNLVFEENDGSVRRDLDFAPMAGSRRITGGIQCLIEGLAQRIPDARCTLNNKLLTLKIVDDRVVADIGTDAQRTSISARVVVITIPPRLLIETVGFSPPLNDSIRRWSTATPTWMAGHAKFVAIYEEPFWRAEGFSGDAISRRGPLLEIHDASPSSTREGALFGFVGTPADQRHGKSSEITDAAISQLTALFGPKAAHPKNILYEDWAEETFTAVSLDKSAPRQHPVYGPAPHADAPWNGRVLFASTEAAQEFGGFLEGALVAAEQAALDVIASQP